MEIWDILDIDGNKTGETIERGRQLDNGKFHLVVHTYLFNHKGESLIQKRSIKKENPGTWDVTGGSVLSGEDSLSGAVREVKEELGIEIDPGSFDHIVRLIREDYLVDVWAAIISVELDKLILQAEEVDEVKFVSPEEMIPLLFKTGRRDEEYREIMEKYIKSMNRGK